jgi:hypothetical protein
MCAAKLPQKDFDAAPFVAAGLSMAAALTAGRFVGSTATPRRRPSEQNQRPPEGQGGVIGANVRRSRRINSDGH